MAIWAAGTSIRLSRRLTNPSCVAAALLTPNHYTETVLYSDGGSHVQWCTLEGNEGQRMSRARDLPGVVPNWVSSETRTILDY